jgi:Spy/CpxP family protein refolding chaperone
MKTLYCTMALIVLLPIVGNVSTAGESKPAGSDENPMAEMLKGLDLTNAQKAKIDKLSKEFGVKSKKVVAKMDRILTPAQKKARAEAIKAAVAAGKKGKELTDAIHSAVTLSAEQEAKMAGATKQMSDLQRELHAKIAGLLTPEQRDQLKKKLLEDSRPQQTD